MMRVCAKVLSEILAVNDTVQKKSKKQSGCFIEHNSWNSRSLHKIYGCLTMHESYLNLSHEH